MLVDMTEHRPEHGPDDTQRIPHDPMSGSSHRYDPAAGQPSSPEFGGFGFDSNGDRKPPRSGRPGTGVIVAILAAALVVGGLAGLVGAAGFTAVDDLVGSDAATSSAPRSSSPVVNRADKTPAPDSVEAVARSVLPSVVKINVQGAEAAGSGSGIIISSDGEILTNNHVASVGAGGQITVNFNDGTAKRARIVGTDPLTDLAVIKAEGVSGLQPATIGRSSSVAVGESVVAIGSPFGLEATVTSGIVSALNRPVSVGPAEGENQAPGSAVGQDTIYPAIQTDAAINPGNSGGPLVNLDGDVIGINSSIRTASSGLDSSSGGSIGLGFAIPMDKVWPVVEQLRKGETATHARLGVSVRDVTSNDGLLSGASVQEVKAGSAAAKAGLEKGDVITKVDDQIITGSDALVATIRGHRPGDTVTLTVVRGTGTKTRTLDAKLESDGGTATR
jgi:putative serine protease PepD